MTDTKSPPRKSRLPKHALRRLVEFKGIRRLALTQYRDRVRQHYDGPAGSVLRLGSIFSLHEPLVGRLIRKRKFDAGRFERILDVGSGAGQILGHLLRAARPRQPLIRSTPSHRPLLCIP